MPKDTRTGREVTEFQAEALPKVRKLEFLTEGHFSVWKSWEDSFLFKFRGTRYMLLVGANEIKWYDLDDVKKKPFPKDRIAQSWVRTRKFVSVEKEGDVWPPFISTIDFFDLCDKELVEHLVFNLDVFIN